MRKSKLIHALMLLFGCSSMFAQNITVKGTVTDASYSENLAGVNVIMKGSSIGTVTDMEGNYSISVPPDTTLVFSYIGYAKQEVAVKKRTLINVVLQEERKSLDEVVVVGVSLKKSDLTGAVGSVSQKVLGEKPVTSINQALQGRVAGVLISNPDKPGSDASIRIRGINTINGTTDPIYVVDGVVMDNHGGGFSSINLNDVASIEVLKDASSTALYGSRASNGVVLITTKKGKSGEGKVTYDGWFGVQSYANMPKTMNSRQLFELSRDAAMNSFDQNNPNATADERNAFLQNRVLTPYTGDLGTGGFVFSQNDVDAYNNPNFQDYNWLDAVTRSATRQNHVAGFSGGSDKGNYYLSFGYAEQTGLIEKLSDKKYTGRFNAEQSVKSWLKVGTNTSFTRTESQIFNDDGVYNSARTANPTLAVTDTLKFLPNWNGTYNDNSFNPINSLKKDNDRVRNRLVSANFVNLNPVKGLNIRTQFSIDYFNEGHYQFQPNDIAEATRNANDGNAKQDFDNLTVWQWDNSVSYDTKIGLHRIFAMLGTSATRSNRNWFNASANGYATNDFSYYNIGANTRNTERSLSSDFVTKTLQSYIARVNYDYMSKYYLTATARYDGSSKFAEGHQWGLFPSFSTAWNIAEEDFMKNQSVFDQLKLRAGYGVVGNQEIADYAFLTLYSPQKDGDKITYVPNGRRGTKDITWESQHQSNIGMDMSFFNNRIRVSADAFLLTNKNLLMTRTLPRTSGFSEAIENVGTIENKGIEFTVDAKIIHTRDWDWNVSANFSADKNKVTQLYDNVNAIYKYDDYGSLTKTDNLFLDQPRNVIYILKTGGIAQQNDMSRLNQTDWNGRNVNPGDLYPQDINNDNKITDLDDRVIIGSADPKFYGGFSTELIYNDLSLNAVFNYSYGAKKLSYMYESLITSVGRGPASIDLLDRWSPENTGAKNPRPILNEPGVNYNAYSASNLDHSVQDGSFLRLSTLTLAYTLPRQWTNTLKANNLRIYTTASNVFCLTPYKGYDPETGDWYPPTRMFTFGVNLTF
ncbi:MAG: TonB-dependent receptor [Tannerella sp.]|jgi:TonB-linked SusC/RagA family outer membrane protein|nr:TonB-dependent receptor [Tannerella sp.]